MECLVLERLFSGDLGVIIRVEWMMVRSGD